jgi:hypothetical protein
MFASIFKSTYNKINFEDIQNALKTPNQYIIINTLPINEQECLIKYTIDYNLEEKTINYFLNEYDFNSKRFIVYGKNANDESIEKKYKQLIGLGFSQVYMYVGGLFEWMLLQDIYGMNEFPTTKKVLDILKFRPEKNIKN